MMVILRFFVFFAILPLIMLAFISGYNNGQTQAMIITEDMVITPDNVGSKHLILHGAFWDKDTVRVLITVDPDAPEDARKYINSVVEGTLIWQEMLEDAFPNGDWNIDVTVQPESNSSFDMTKYDVLTIITSGDEHSCSNNYRGVTYFGVYHSQGYITNMVSISDPCNPDKFKNQDAVKSIAAHEFGHALGLEHTINVDYDLMCSGSCGKVDFFATPSLLNIKGLGFIYGEDGFTSPNRVSTELRGMKFFDKDAL